MLPRIVQSGISAPGQVRYASHTDLALNNRLCGYWGFDMDGMDASSTSAIIYDIAVGATRGTCSGTIAGAVTMVDGQIGKALNVVAGNKGKVTIAANTAFNTGYGTEFSISLWIKAVSFNTYNVLAGQWDETNSKRQWAITVFNTDSKVHLYNCDDGIGSGLHVDSILSTSTLATGTLYHLVGTADAVGKKIYINGKLDNSGGTGIATFQGSNVLTMGGPTTLFAGQDGAAYFNGSIDDVRFYNRRIDATEVMQLYYTGLNGMRDAAQDLPSLTSVASSIAFRRTLSSFGSRAGSRQVHRV